MKRKMDRRVLSHDDVAEHIIKSEGLAFALGAAMGATHEDEFRQARAYLKKAIVDALQEAFDLGFRAAGGSIHKLDILR
jgi:hypothetical protein